MGDEVALSAEHFLTAGAVDEAVGSCNDMTVHFLMSNMERRRSYCAQSNSENHPISAAADKPREQHIYIFRCQT